MNRLYNAASEPRDMIGRRALFALSAVSLALAATASRPVGARASDSDASAPIRQLNAALLAAMKDSRASFGQRSTMLTPAVEQAFDLDAVLQASIGLRWASLSPDQRAALATTFRRYTVSSYAANFDSYSGQSFRILPGARRLPNGETVVNTQLVRTDGSVTAIDYVMRQTPAGWRAVDVLADGSISRVAVQRSDFRGLLDNGGVSALQAGLQRKVASLSGGSAA